MSALTRKVYDVPVSTKWYVVHVDVNSRTIEGKALVEFKEKWAEEVENGKVARIEVPLEDNAQTKKLRTMTMNIFFIHLFAAFLKTKIWTIIWPSTEYGK
ncbi:unnamed protein product [Caenorhabditis brenneri]